jgi:hypothetical protein
VGEAVEHLERFLLVGYFLNFFPMQKTVKQSELKSMPPLSAERVAEINSFRGATSDFPELSPSQLAGMQPVHAVSLAG